MNRKAYFTTIADLIPADGLQYVQNAYYIVKDAHRKQSRRLTGERYFEHVRRVSWTAAVEFGYADPHTIALALLHDVIEDTFTPSSIIVNLFGRRMYEDIMFLSKEVPSFNTITGELIGRAKISDDSYYSTLMSRSCEVGRVSSSEVHRRDQRQDHADCEHHRRSYGPGDPGQNVGTVSCRVRINNSMSSSTKTPFVFFVWQKYSKVFMLHFPWFSIGVHKYFDSHWGYDFLPRG